MVLGGLAPPLKALELGEGPLVVALISGLCRHLAGGDRGRAGMLDSYNVQKVPLEDGLSHVPHDSENRKKSLHNYLSLDLNSAFHKNISFSF